MHFRTFRIAAHVEQAQLAPGVAGQHIPLPAACGQCLDGFLLLALVRPCLLHHGSPLGPRVVHPQLYRRMKGYFDMFTL